MQKPTKPYPDFPLTPHASGKWMKKIRRKIYYFGRWDDWQGALNEYLAVKDYLHAGMKPPASGSTYTLADACEDFYRAWQKKCESGEVSQRTLNDYDRHCRLLIDFFGKDRLCETIGPPDFKRFREHLTAKWGPVTVVNVIRRTKTLFNWLYEVDAVDSPIRFGGEFKPPTKAEMRKARNAKPAREFSRDELLTLIDAASVHLKAVILLAINGGMGQTDIARIEFRNVDLDAAYVKFPRPKTGINREFALWPETVDALVDSISERPAPKEGFEQLIFLTRFGVPWVRDKVDGSRSDAILLQFNKLKRQCGITGRSKGFYALRHTFRTVADEVKDQPAIDFVMGHADNSIADSYRERIDRWRLEAVTNHVHSWLFSDVQEKS